MDHEDPDDQRLREAERRRSEKASQQQFYTSKGKGNAKEVADARARHIAREREMEQARAAAEHRQLLDEEKKCMDVLDKTLKIADEAADTCTLLSKKVCTRSTAFATEEANKKFKEAGADVKKALDAKEENSLRLKAVIAVREIFSGECLSRFTRLPSGVLEYLMQFLPLVVFLKLLGTCRFFCRLFPMNLIGEKPCKLLWEVEFDYLKASFSFIHDFSVFMEYMEWECVSGVAYNPNKGRIKCIHEMYRNYFGFALMVSEKNIDVLKSYAVPVVILDCLFFGRPGPALRGGFSSNMVDDLEDWLWGCVVRQGTGINPVGCIETLSVAGFFATHHSRSRFIEELIMLQSFYRTQKTDWWMKRLLILISFLLRLARESFELRRYTVDSRTWQATTPEQGVRFVDQNHFIWNTPLVDVSATDFQRLFGMFTLKYKRRFTSLELKFHFTD